MNDPYLHIYPCVERLVSEWRRHRRIIIAVDYDDTVYDYHKKGHTYEAVIGLLRDCTVNAGAYLCVFTSSSPDKYPSIRAHMAELGLPVSSINENPFPMPFGNHGKMYYNILLDDRAGLGQAFDTLALALRIYLTTPKTT